MKAFISTFIQKLYFEKAPIFFVHSKAVKIKGNFRQSYVDPIQILQLLTPKPIFICVLEFHQIRPITVLYELCTAHIVNCFSGGREKICGGEFHSDGWKICFLFWSPHVFPKYKRITIQKENNLHTRIICNCKIGLLNIDLFTSICNRSIMNSHG